MVNLVETPGIICIQGTQETYLKKKDKEGLPEVQTDHAELLPACLINATERDEMTRNVS